MLQLFLVIFQGMFVHILNSVQRNYFRSKNGRWSMGDAFSRYINRFHIKLCSRFANQRSTILCNGVWRMLVYQNLTAKGYSGQFNQPQSDIHIGDYITVMKPVFHWWCLFAKVTTFQEMCDIVIKYMIPEKWHANLCTFLLHNLILICI